MDTKALALIAKNNKVSERFVRFLEDGDRHTDIPYLAIDIARETGEKPINYIRPGRRSLFRRIMPSLNRRVK